MAQWELWLILFFLAWILVGFGNDLLVLRQYGLLDHLPCFSVDGKGNIPLTNFALRRIREGDEKTSGGPLMTLMSWTRKQSSKEMEA
jgi:hypothetical protein